LTFSRKGSLVNYPDSLLARKGPESSYLSAPTDQNGRCLNSWSDSLPSDQDAIVINGYPASLDIYGQITTKSTLTPNSTSTRKAWTRKQKRSYQRLMSLLGFWVWNGYQILFICLTSSPESDPNSLNSSFAVLKQRIERALGFKNIEHLLIKTSEGYGVYHGFLAYKPKKGERSKSFFIPQNWLSDQWADIHKAPVVWIKRVRANNLSRKKLSRYCVSQYCVNQYRDGECALVRISWSWKRGLGGALVKTWNGIREFYKGWGKRGAALDVWERVLKCETVIMRITGTNFAHVVHPPPDLHIEYNRLVPPHIHNGRLLDYSL